MGKNFAVHVVHVLSSFDGRTQHKPEVAMAMVGLKVMVCDSASINPVHDAIAAGWNDRTTLTEELIDGLHMELGAHIMCSAGLEG